MTNFSMFFVAAVAAVALPSLAQAAPPATTPQKYCTALGKTYDRYVGGSHGDERLAAPGYGEAACREHHAERAIPVLEKVLREARVPLPPHVPAVAEQPRAGGPAAASL